MISPAPLRMQTYCVDSDPLPGQQDWVRIDAEQLLDVWDPSRPQRYLLREGLHLDRVHLRGYGSQGTGATPTGTVLAAGPAWTGEDDVVVTLGADASLRDVHVTAAHRAPVAVRCLSGTSHLDNVMAFYTDLGFDLVGVQSRALVNLRASGCGAGILAEGCNGLVLLGPRVIDCAGVGITISGGSTGAGGVTLVSPEPERCEVGLLTMGATMTTVLGGHYEACTRAIEAHGMGLLVYGGTIASPYLEGPTGPGVPCIRVGDVGWVRLAGLHGGGPRGHWAIEADYPERIETIGRDLWDPYRGRPDDLSAMHARSPEELADA